MTHHLTLISTARAVIARLSRARLLLCLLLAPLGALSAPTVASAGTYVINNGPSAPVPNENAGPWGAFGGEQGAQASFTGPGSWIGPLGGSMAVNEVAGVGVGVPGGSGVTIREAKIWWYVPAHVGGGDTFAQAHTSAGLIGQAVTPDDHRSTPDDFILPSTTTSFWLGSYCSNDAASAPCSMGGDSNPDLELFGSQLTLADSNLPSGNVTGGALAGGGSLGGPQSIAYNASDSDSGVRTVQLLVDGNVVAQHDYIAQCPYDNFLACPGTVSDTMPWNTATVADGSHEVALKVLNAANNATIVDDHTVTTANAPSITAPPSIAGAPVTGQTLSATPGSTTSDPNAGAVGLSGQWLRCDATGANCAAIPGAAGTSYNPVVSDLGATIRYLQRANNNDGGTSAQSAPVGPISSAASGTGTTGGSGSGAGGSGGSGSSTGGPGGAGGTGTGGTGGTGGQGGPGGVTIIAPPGAITVLQGTTARWSVTLHVSPVRVHRKTLITLTGHVNTAPRPANGKLIYLQARSGTNVWRGHGKSRHRVVVYGPWVTFQALRAGRGGNFKAHYRFRFGGRHRYQFHAVAPQEGGFRNPTGNSAVVAVNET
jgi:hypothetical protein